MKTLKHLETKQGGREHDRFVIPLEVVLMLMNPLEMPEWHLWPNLHPSGSVRSIPAAFLASMQPWPPAGLQREATRKGLGPARILPDFSSAPHHGPAATTVYGEYLSTFEQR